MRINPPILTSSALTGYSLDSNWKVGKLRSKIPDTALPEWDTHFSGPKKQLNRYWIKRLSLFGGKWKSQMSQIGIGINDYIHKDHKNQIGLFFQLFVYILKQF